MAANTPSGSTSQEYIVRVPKNAKKHFHVMRFNGSLNIDFTKWNHVKMERENNLKEFKSGIDDDMPKYGAGSEFGKDAREEARRKKYGIMAKKYRPEDQPWIIKLGGKNGKKFKGIREGGVGENASYYVFTQATDGAFEAFPIEEWYNFSSIQRYNALSAEEAEEAFGRRNKVLNYFSIMLKKRLKNEDDDINEEEKEGKSSKKMKELKISELDDWDGSSSSEEEEEDGEKKEEDNSNAAKKKKKKNMAKKKSKKDTDDEAMEDSDDGDEEGREVDYISDSASSDEEANKTDMNLIGVAEEDALRNLLTSDEEEEEETENKEDKEPELDGDQKVEEEESRKKKKNKKEKSTEPDMVIESSSSLSESSQSENELDSALFLQKKKKHKKSSDKRIIDDSRSDTPTKGAESRAMKRKLEDSIMGDGAGGKKGRLEGSPTVTNFGSGNSSPGDTGITEEAVRKYLMRKPMTTTELLQKFKSKKTGLPTEQLVTVLAQILKRINPSKQTIKGKLYLLLKS